MMTRKLHRKRSATLIFSSRRFGNRLYSHELYFNESDIFINLLISQSSIANKSSHLRCQTVTFIIALDSGLYLKWNSFEGGGEGFEHLSRASSIELFLAKKTDLSPSQFLRLGSPIVSIARSGAQTHHIDCRSRGHLLYSWRHHTAHWSSLFHRFLQRLRSYWTFNRIIQISLSQNIPSIKLDCSTLKSTNVQVRNDGIIKNDLIVWGSGYLSS